MVIATKSWGWSDDLTFGTNHPFWLKQIRSRLEAVGCPLHLRNLRRTLKLFPGHHYVACLSPSGESYPWCITMKLIMYIIYTIHLQGGVPKPRVSILTYTDIYCNCSKDLMTSGIWMGDLDRTPQIHPNPPQFWAPHGSDGRTCTQAGVPLWHCSCARSWVGTGGPILSLWFGDIMRYDTW